MGATRPKLRLKRQVVDANSPLFYLPVSPKGINLGVGVAHKTAKRQDYSLAKNSIEGAIVSETTPKDLIFHSDGGRQYRSWDYHFQVTENGITPSISKPATPGDNATVGNFLSTFKAECIHLEKPKTLTEADRLTYEFVQYYNYERIQGNGLTPFEERKSATRLSGTLTPPH